jgi:hypothetical protein
MGDQVGGDDLELGQDLAVRCLAQALMKNWRAWSREGSNMVGISL